MNEAIEEPFCEDESFSDTNCDVQALYVPVMSSSRTLLPAGDVSAAFFDSVFDFCKMARDSRFAGFLFSFWYYQQCVHDFSGYVRANADFSVFSVKFFALCFCWAASRRFAFLGVDCALKQLFPFAAAFCVTVPIPQMYRVYRRSALGLFAVTAHAAGESADILRLARDSRMPLSRRFLILAAPLLMQELLTGPFRGEPEELSRICIIGTLFVTLKRWPAAMAGAVFVCELIDSTVDFQGGSRGAFYMQVLSALWGLCGRAFTSGAYGGNF